VLKVHGAVTGRSGYDQHPQQRIVRGRGPRAEAGDQEKQSGEKSPLH